MIFGSEGLPRSGKSLDAMQHIVDSMIAGRTVVTNVIGVSHEAIAEFCTIPLPTVQRLLQVIEPPKDLDEDEKVAYVKAQFMAKRVPDCLLIWDEINQFWPPDRQPLAADWAKFVTEHGHEGIDILIMGQDLSELHTTFRKRLQRYTRFTKLDMMGKEDHFHWASYTNVGKNKFRRMAEGKKPYNTKLFPLYKSHRDDTQNKGNYTDSRFNVFQAHHKIFACMLLAALGGCGYVIYGFFHPDLPEAKVATPKTAETPAAPAQDFDQQSIQPAPTPKTTTVTTNYAQADIETEAQPIDYLDKFATKYQPRLTGIIDRANPQPGKAAFEFVIEFVDESYRVKERMGRSEIVALGWAIERHPYGLLINKDGHSHVVRPWPLDNWGKVPQNTIAQLKPSP